MNIKKKWRDRASKQYMIAVWIVLLILAVCIFFATRSQKQNLKVASSGNLANVQAPTERSKGYSGPSSPQFNQDLIDKGKKDAQEARQNGESFVAPLTNGETQVPEDQFDILKKAKRFEEKKPPVEEIKVTPAPNVIVSSPARTTPERTVTPPENARLDQKRAQIRTSLNAQLNQISQRMVYHGHKAMEYKPVASPQATSASQGSSSSTAATEQNTDFNMVKTLGIRPGDVFYAGNMQTINTDTPAPVATVELLSGPLKHSIAQGTFELVGEKIRFTFSKLTDENGNQYEMTGFAVDPATKFAGVASEVDHHYLSRWGGILAGSLLSGYADATKNSGSSTSTNVASGLITSSNPEYNLKDKFWIASGEVAKNLSDVAKANFNRAVTAWLKSNDPIGVLIIDLKPIK